MPSRNATNNMSAYTNARSTIQNTRKMQALRVAELRNVLSTMENQNAYKAYMKTRTGFQNNRKSQVTQIAQIRKAMNNVRGNRPNVNNSSEV